MFGKLLLAALGAANLAQAATHTFRWTTGYVTANPDGFFERQVVGCNGEYPWPDIRVTRGDRIIVELTNGLPDQNTSLHFHGLFQNGTTLMDGPEMVSQCPIPTNQTMIYNFTVDQVGAYWYHSHSKGQYGDGFRGAVIIEDPEPLPYEYDEETSWVLTEWYHDTIPVLTRDFLNLYNPTGAEPIPQTLLLNNSYNNTWEVRPNTTYKVNIINTGAFLSQYVWMEDHDMTVVEIDGIYVEPNTTNMIYITVAQRYTVLITTKNETNRNYALMQKMDEDMLDVLDGVITLNSTNTISYSSDNAPVEQYYVDSLDEYLDDFYLQPVEAIERYDDYDMQITVDVAMDNLGNGVNYAFFNNITYTAPKVPTALTAMTAGEFNTESTVYGSNTNAFVLQKDEIIELVLNNLDTGKHPFHLHGHVFQVLERAPGVDDDQDPVAYNETDHAEWPDYPMRRDTLYVLPQSYFVLRFKADNPGVWYFHCHIEWHLLQGLALVLVEAPTELAQAQTITENHRSICEAAGINPTGNAAANSDDWLDIRGENTQHKALPAGFTAKGIVALVFSCIAGVLGCIVIGIYGMAEMKDIEKRVVEDLNIDVYQIADEEDESTESGSATK